jgi:hypothetical protein
MIIQLIRKLSHVLYSDGSGVAHSDPVSSRPSLPPPGGGGIRFVTLLPLPHHAIYHAISPSSHVLKETPPSVRVEIREQSLLTIGR